MFTIITLIVVITIAWFWYTDRRNTVTAVKTSTGVVAKGISESFKFAKAEADIAKVNNDIANIETDRLEKFAARNADRIVRNVLADIGLDKDLKASQAKRLAEAKAKLEEAKAKAGKK